jgi:BirA family transcriptional regulator, biotin operon repressor / biotin---[acetyl-CoA-carboxylase] ligase
LALALHPASWSGLSLAVGVGLAQALDPTGRRLASRPWLGLKWPNDLWLMGMDGLDGARKMGGVLIETVVQGDLRVAVIGVGLNLRAFAVESPLEPGARSPFASGFASLDELGLDLSPEACLKAILPALMSVLCRFESAGFEAFVDDFKHRDVLWDRDIGLPGAAASWARGNGVDALGRLWAVLPDGGRVCVGAGEVSLRARVAVPQESL